MWAGPQIEVTPHPKLWFLKISAFDGFGRSHIFTDLHL